MTGGPQQVRVLAAHRQPLFREAVARAVRQHAGFRLVAEAGDGRAALALVARRAPDVAVVGDRLPGLDGTRILNAVTRDRLPTRVLLLADSLDGAAAHAAVGAGAAGWLPGTTGEDELCAAIAAAARGDVALGAGVETAIADEIRRRAGSAEPVLSPRESQVLRLVAAGRSASEIGREIHISTGAVKASLLALYRRLGVSERAAAVAVALRRGLID